MDMISVSSYSIKIEPISFAYLMANRLNVINAIAISKQLSSIFDSKEHVISNFIGTMACLFYFNHLCTKYATYLMSVSAHPSRSKLRGIH